MRRKSLRGRGRIFLLISSGLVLVGCSNSPSKSGLDAGVALAPPRPPAVTGVFQAVDKAGPEHPVRLAVASDGTVFASDPRVNQVVGYQGGRKVVQLGGLDGPLGIAVFGQKLLVGNTGRQDVEVYDLTAQRYLGVLGSGQGEVTMPNSIAVGPDGRAYVADSRENVVKIYAVDGTRSSTVGGAGPGNGQFSFPVAVAVDDNGFVVADQGNHRVQRFDNKGTWLRSVGMLPDSKAATQADLRGRFTTISGVALMNGDIYVVDSAHGHVQVLDNAGNTKSFLGSVGSCRTCTRLALDATFTPDGTLLVSDPLARRWVTPTAVTP